MRQSPWSSHSFHVHLLSGGHYLEEYRKNELHWVRTSGTLFVFLLCAWFDREYTLMRQ